MSSRRRLSADFADVGAGPLVVLVHASMSGARQWHALGQAVQDRFRLRALNLFGYGRTPAWAARRAPTLDDHADLVLSAIPPEAGEVTLVGHSFGGAVAMQAARRLGAKSAKLALIEPSLFYLLDAAGRDQAYGEIASVARDMARLPSEQAAERFIGYWTGPESWTVTPAERRAAYARAVGLVLYEFGAALVGSLTLEDWGAALPQRTLVISAGDTKRPSREVVELLSLAGTKWQFARVPDGGHMSPLTRPDLVNSILAGFFDRA